MKELVTLQEAAEAVNKTVHNIRDYIQRGRIGKYNSQGTKIEKARNGELRVDLTELRAFLQLVNENQAVHHHAGLNAELGFYGLAEHKRTKHVHRLHPYLGKFIPQLVEWFLRRYFNQGDIILDPFLGSGTTLIQANELDMQAIGIDISEFCCRIARAKTDKYDIEQLRFEVSDAEKRTQRFSNRLAKPDRQLPLFPDDEFEEFKANLVAECTSEYLRTWFAPDALLEILYYRRLIRKGDYIYKDLLRILLSRAVRSSRLVPHYDLARPKEPLPVGKEYWCRKHKRMCMPIDNCITKIHAYSNDTVRRIEEFSRLRSNRDVDIIHQDARLVNLNGVLQGQKLDGIFTSPPYVGQIDYHDQHIYAYELFDIERRDEQEIGPKSRGKSKKAREDYVEGIATVFKNVSQFMKDDGNVFIVANDRFDLYPKIAQLSGLKIVEEFHRAVTKRTEQGNDPYQETIFWMKKENQRDKP